MKLYSISLAVFTFSLVYIKHWSIDNHWTVCSTAMRLVCSTCWVYILRQSIRFQGHYYSNISKHITNGNTHTHSARFNANHINAVNRLRKKRNFEIWLPKKSMNCVAIGYHDHRKHMLKTHVHSINWQWSSQVSELSTSKRKKESIIMNEHKLNFYFNNWIVW